MGRQAYITRLALGRSPYEAPVLSESGEFILGPYAHEFDNADSYVQQYNERGHPEFRASRVAGRELRRAKNDVLSTVGVVYKTATPKRSADEERELLKTVKSENEAGFFLSAFDNVAMLSSLWWLSSLRMRVQVFRYSTPLTQIIMSEVQMVGMKAFLFAGLPACLVSAGLSSWRKSWTNRRFRRALVDFRLAPAFDFGFFLLCATIESFGRLQCLHLIPTAQTLSLDTLISLWPLRRLDTFRGVLTSPILLLWLHTFLESFLQFSLWRVIRTRTPTPDRPDQLSNLAAQDIKDPETRVLGHRKQHLGLGAGLFLQISSVTQWVQDTKVLLRYLLGMQEVEEASSRASTATPEPGDLFVDDFFQGFQQRQQDSAAPEADGPEPVSRTNTLYTPLDQSPATTPPVSPRVRASLIHGDSETVTMQLELLESAPIFPALSRNEIAGDEEERHGEQGLRDESRVARAHRPPRQNGVGNDDEEENSPSGHAEAEVADQDVAMTVNQLTQAIQQRTNQQQEERSGQNPASPHDQDQDHHFLCKECKTKELEHRATALSTLPATSFTSHLTHLLVTAALLPLESMLVRSLVRTSLSSHLSSSSAAISKLPYNGRSSLLLSLHQGQGQWRAYSSNILLLLGMQALLSSAVWGVETAVALGMGRRWYGWGRGRGSAEEKLEGRK